MSCMGIKLKSKDREIQGLKLFTGHYTVERQGGQIKMVLIPSGGWKPRPDKLSLRFLYTVAGVFKKWPATYEWNATISETSDDTYHMVSGWKRIR